MNPSIIWLLLLVLWAVQVMYPQLSFPEYGSLGATMLGALVAMSWLMSRRQLRQGSIAARTNPAAVAGSMFIAYLWLRWLWAGTPAIGAATFGTVLQAGAWAFAARMLLQQHIATRADSPREIPSSMIMLLIATMAIVCIACGLHAAHQYFVSYAESYSQLRESIGPRVPTAFEEALLHHFRIRRVASVWGDPNTLAGFCAMTIAALPGLWSAATKNAMQRNALRFLAIGAACAGVAAIVLSGSRGGLLDLFLAGAFWFVWRLNRNRALRALPPAAVAAMLIAIGFFCSERAQCADESRPQQPAGWMQLVSRSNTIRERMHYATVGSAMLKQNPIFGMGVGSVDLYFGRLKPPEARETKYLHNWVLQIGAETGTVGLALALAFLILLLWRLRGTECESSAVVAAPLMAAMVFLCDGLVQLSFNSRELLALFGLCCGALLCVGSRAATSALRAIPSTLAAAALVAGAIIYAVPSMMTDNYLQIAREAAEAGDQVGARKYIRKAADVARNDPRPFAFLAGLDRDAGHYSSALSQIERAIELQPESASLRASKADILISLGKTDDAKSSLEEALRRYPSNPEYNAQMSRMMESAGHATSAMEYARRAARYSDGLPGHEQHQERLKTLEPDGATTRTTTLPTNLATTSSLLN